MAKYNPTTDDIYSTKPCFICGKDVLDEDTDVCSENCKQMKELYDADWESMMYREDFEDEEG